MTLNLWTIALCVALAIVIAAWMPPRLRAWALMVLSVLGVYALQPPLTLYYADYWLPTLTIGLTVAVWGFTLKPPTDGAPALAPADRRALLVLGALLVGVACFYFLPPAYRLTPSRPPHPLWLLMALALWALFVWGARALLRARRVLVFGMVLLVVLFVLLKSAPLATLMSAGWRAWVGMDASLAKSTELNWLGFSYVAFRLIHLLRDRQTGLLPNLCLRDALTYVVFFPALIAGPIDRAERFMGDMSALATLPRWDAPRWAEGFRRIAVGLFKKFVLADLLAAGVALNAQNALESGGGVWLWVLLYGYGLRLFLDFSGYTDIALGVALLFGVHLPENFNRPYLKTDITSFWQSWHITLSNWARFYVFSPLSRGILRRKPKPPQWVAVLSAQLATMLTIGLWHGVTWNFLIWGLWHGVGLFVHKQWTDHTRKWERELKAHPRRYALYRAGGWLLTVQFVMLGWVWFAVPTLPLAWRVFVGLFGGQIP